MKYIDAEKLKAKIERRKGYISVTHFAEKLLSFIDSLQQEQPEVDLEKLALERYPVQMMPGDSFEWQDYDFNEYERKAYLEGLKKGYELGRKGGKNYE